VSSTAVPWHRLLTVKIFSASRAEVLSSQTPVQNSTELTKSESESELLYDWRFTANQFVLGTSTLRLTTSNFIFQLNTCDYSPYVTSSLTRGCVCRLQLLLVFASAVIIRSESRRSHDQIFTVSDSRLSQPGGRIPRIYTPRNRVVRLYPQALSSHSSPPTTRRATVEVFVPTWTD
jgi:hypothetical protein